MTRALILSTALAAIAAAAASGQSKSAAKPVALTAMDYVEIRQLVNRYAFALDTGNNNGYDYADLFAVDGEFIRILGRKSELINVAGEKVHPTEVEDVLLRLDNVRDATVSGKQNPVTGQVVAAKITLLTPEEPAALIAWLCGPGSSGITGAALPVDGGLTTGPRHAWDPEEQQRRMQMRAAAVQGASQAN